MRAANKRFLEEIDSKLIDTLDSRLDAFISSTNRNSSEKCLILIRGPTFRTSTHALLAQLIVTCVAAPLRETFLPRGIPPHLFEQRVNF